MQQPKNSPWGQVDQVTGYGDGVYFVSTPGHGGFMVAKSVHLSEAAKAEADEFGAFLCFEEDCLAAIVVQELNIQNKANTEDIKRSLCFWLPRYVKASGNEEWLKQFPTRE